MCALNAGESVSFALVGASGFLGRAPQLHGLRLLANDARL
jgi:hypothetical protein